ncbi:hypothetical protein D3C85_1438050 [compost metagenome]
MTEAAEARQQPAHGQGGGCLQAHRGIVDPQRGAGPFQGIETLAQARQQHAGRLRELQVAPLALEQATGKMLLQGADVPAHRALGDGQLLGGTGEGRMAGGSLEGTQGIERGQAARHMPRPMSNSYGWHHFFPFVPIRQGSENC